MENVFEATPCDPVNSKIDLPKFSGSTLCEKILFRDFSKICEKIWKCKDRKSKYDLLEKFFYSMREGKENFNLFPIVRLLVPKLERERGPYGLKAVNLGKLYVRVLCLPKNGPSTQKLLEFRTPSSSNRTGVGDFGEVAYWILKNKCGEGGVLTIGDVNKHLDSIALKHSQGEPRGVDDEFCLMVNKMSAEEQKWLIRIVLKEIPLGLGVNKILLAYHADGPEYLEYNNNLLRMCTLLQDPTSRLHEIDIKLFEPFRPMLSQRVDVGNISISGRHYVESKMDGERFQLHYAQGKFKYFSRNSYDYTWNFGEDISSGHFTFHIAKQFPSEVSSCVLDGEMMGWNTNRKVFGSKGQNFDIKLMRVGNVIQPCFCVFDVLYFNGEVVTGKSLEERLEIVEKCFTPLEGLIVHVPRSTVSTSEEVLAALNRAIDNFEEGIVLKNPHSIYKPNGRNFGWTKIKPEYTPGAMVELDLLIVGGSFGENRHRGLVTHFIVALASDLDSSQYLALTRVGSGCSDEELAELGNKLSPHWKKFKPLDPPPNILFGSEKPDLWIDPQNSVIVQVKATEVTHSTSFKTKYTLRFPRIEKVRYDKPWSDCLTAREFDWIRASYKGKLTAGHIETNFNSRPQRKRKAVSIFHEPDHLKITNVSGVTVDADIFQGREFCVITGTPEHPKASIETKIVQCGGKICQNPGSGTYCVLAGDLNLRAKNLIRAKLHNILKIDWILKSISNSKCSDLWQVEDCVSLTVEKAAELSRQLEKESGESKDTSDCMKPGPSSPGEENDGSPRGGVRAAGPVSPGEGPSAALKDHFLSESEESYGSQSP